jgi:hypothetical protein
MTKSVERPEELRELREEGCYSKMFLLELRT